MFKPSQQFVFSPICRNYSSGLQKSEQGTREASAEFDPDLERIVDDVDSMYRDQLRMIQQPEIKSNLNESLTR
jgi:hypothetical protein